ncbi:MAG: hypothetical protein V3W44_02635, partial [Dehalococcoidales bacterium]
MNQSKLEKLIQDKKDDLAFIESILPLLEQCPGRASLTFPHSPSILVHTWDEYKKARRLFKGMLTKTERHEANDGSTWVKFKFKESGRPISFNVDP